jgi:hypothetical protein
MIENISLGFLVLALVCFLVGRLGIVKPRKRRYYPFVLRTPDPSRHKANVKPEPTRVDAKTAFARVSE